MEQASEIAKRITVSEQPQANTPTSSQTSGSKVEPCETCHGDAYVRTTRGLVRCPTCSTRARINAELPPLYRGASLADFPANIREPVASWLASNSTGGMLVQGPCGTGKTYLAAAVVRERLASGQQAKFGQCADLYRELRECFHGDMSERSVLNSYEQAPLLVLDDLGAGNLSSFERRSTLELIDRRLQNLLPTVVTTNWPLERISSEMDDRIASRLSGFFRVEMGGKDRRTGS